MCVVHWFVAETHCEAVRALTEVKPHLKQLARLERTQMRPIRFSECPDLDEKIRLSIFLDSPSQ